MYWTDVPCKPFVKKYLQARCGADIFVINKEDRIGKMFYAYLGRSPRTFERKKPDLGDTIKIAISDWYVHERGVHLSNSHIIDLNDFIKLELIEEIARYILNIKNNIGVKKYKELYIKQDTATKRRTRIGHQAEVVQYFERKEIIYDILAKYNITEDDFPFETIDKACRRLSIPLLTA